MLAAPDFDIAGVGQKLQLARTYNSLEAPWARSPSAGGRATSATCGSVTPRWSSSTPPATLCASSRPPLVASPPRPATPRT
ncbi:hypothetical protein [Streptomyces pharetrae]|uniref:hypothetical protein n=1 Tax=Streptomyces pharetrae TaxID=291370 RepID=UPI003D9FA4B0